MRKVMGANVGPPPGMDDPESERRPHLGAPIDGIFRDFLSSPPSGLPIGPFGSFPPPITGVIVGMKSGVVLLSMDVV